MAFSPMLRAFSIVRTRRRLLAAAQALRETGARPPGADDPAIFRDARGGYLVSDDKTAWQEIYLRQLAQAQRPRPLPLRAAASRLHPRHVVPECSETYQPEVPVKVGEWIGPALATPDLVLDAHPPAQAHV